MIRVTQRHVVFVLGAVVCIILASLMLPSLNRDRQMGQLTVSNLSQNAPPQLVLATTALGGFRGLLVAGIWWRAAEMQSEGRYWELVQLYDWIGEMQPHLDTIWKFAGWNMAYNIVAEIHEPEERWRWLWRSIETMRDKGLKYNPRSYIIPEQIAWTFFQKIGRETDEYYRYYMHELAVKIENDWGSGHPDLAAIANGPKTVEELMKAPQAGDLIKRFQAEGIDLVEQYDQIGKLLPTVSNELQRWYNLPEHASARKLIGDFRIGRVIRKTYKMDPEQMALMEGQITAMDWRLPEPHCIYWAEVATSNGRTYGTAKDGTDVIDATRDITFSLETLYRRGTIISLDKKPGGDMVLTSNLDYLDPYDRLLEKMVIYYTTPPGDQERGAETILEKQKGFYKEAMMVLYFAGQNTRALDYYKRLQNRYPSEDYVRLTLDQYVLGQIQQMVKEWGREEKIEYVVDGILLQAYTFLVAGKSQWAAAYENEAKAIWDYYRADLVRMKPGPESEKTPTYDEMKLKVRNKMLAGEYKNVPPQIVEGLRSILAESGGATPAETAPVPAPATPTTPADTTRPTATVPSAATTVR